MHISSLSHIKDVENIQNKKRNIYDLISKKYVLLLFVHRNNTISLEFHFLSIVLLIFETQIYFPEFFCRLEHDRVADRVVNDFTVAQAKISSPQRTRKPSRLRRRRCRYVWFIAKFAPRFHGEYRPTCAWIPNNLICRDPSAISCLLGHVWRSAPSPSVWSVSVVFTTPFLPLCSSNVFIVDYRWAGHLDLDDRSDRRWLETWKSDNGLNSPGGDVIRVSACAGNAYCCLLKTQSTGKHSKRFLLPYS